MKRSFLVFLLTALMTAGLAADPAAQALGFWKSVSDVKGEEGKVTALWKLSLDARGQLRLLRGLQTATRQVWCRQ